MILRKAKTGDPPRGSEALGGRALFLVEIGKFLAFFRQSLQKRSWLPKLAVLPVKFLDAVEDFFQTDCVGVPHWSATIGREAVTVQVDDVNVDGAQSVTFLEDACALIYQRVDAAVDNFFFGNLPLSDTRFHCPFAHQLGDFRIRNCAAVFVILVPASSGFLAIAAHLAEIIAGKRLANSWLFQVPIFLADSPADIESGKI